MKYSDLANKTVVDVDDDGIVSNAAEQCNEHHRHVFGNFFIEQHMIPTIMQQFLIDMGIRKISSQPMATYSDLDGLDDGPSLDVNEIEEFWNGYLTAIPKDLDLIWDTIDNGLMRYLQVL